MKWFDRWFNKKVAQAMCNEPVKEEGQYYKGSISIGGSVSKSRSNKIDAERAIRFTVSKAQGGTIIETNCYDHVRDRNSNGLYVLTDDQDLGKMINKIITMESLKQ
jgi:hypothetical protein